MGGAFASGDGGEHEAADEEPATRFALVTGASQRSPDGMKSGEMTTPDFAMRHWATNWPDKHENPQSSFPRKREFIGPFKVNIDSRFRGNEGLASGPK